MSMLTLIIQNASYIIQQRISNLSKTADIFYNEIQPFADALVRSGHKQILNYKSKENTSKKKRTRRRNVIWFNPPFNKEVSTNLAAKFLLLIEKPFRINSKHYKYFNRNTIKVSYSCLPNMKNIISSHNKKILNDQELHAQTSEQLCNCRNGSTVCPLGGHCLAKAVIYKATVSSRTSKVSKSPSNGNNDSVEYAEYIGLASNSFKERYNNHQQSFRHEKYRNSTSLSKYIWTLKNKGIPFEINWTVVSSAHTYHPSRKKCHLCVLEKTLILTSDHNFPLNKKSEITSKCRHRDKFLLEHK